MKIPLTTKPSSGYLVYLNLGCLYLTYFAFLAAYSVFELMMISRKVSPSPESLNHLVVLENLWSFTSGVGLPLLPENWLASSSPSQVTCWLPDGSRSQGLFLEVFLLIILTAFFNSEMSFWRVEKAFRPCSRISVNKVVRSVSWVIAWNVCKRRDECWKLSQQLKLQNNGIHGNFYTLDVKNDVT